MDSQFQSLRIWLQDKNWTKLTYIFNLKIERAKCSSLSPHAQLKLSRVGWLRNICFTLFTVRCVEVLPRYMFHCVVIMWMACCWVAWCWRSGMSGLWSKTEIVCVLYTCPGPLSECIFFLYQTCVGHWFLLTWTAPTRAQMTTRLSTLLTAQVLKAFQSYFSLCLLPFHLLDEALTAIMINPFFGPVIMAFSPAIKMSRRFEHSLTGQLVLLLFCS